MLLLCEYKFTVCKQQWTRGRQRVVVSIELNELTFAPPPSRPEAPSSARACPCSQTPSGGPSGEWGTPPRGRVRRDPCAPVPERRICHEGDGEPFVAEGVEGEGLRCVWLSTVPCRTFGEHPSSSKTRQETALLRKGSNFEWSGTRLPGLLQCN